MGMTWEDMLEVLTGYCDVEFRDDAERAEKRIAAIEFTLQRMLEKLRDKNI